MSVNKHKPHVLVLPEDDANREIANGFLRELSLNQRCIQILPIEGGWGKVLDAFVKRHLSGLRTHPQRHLVLLIDFDEQVEERMQLFMDVIPEDVRERVYLLGTLDEPEPLRRDCGRSLEKIGETLAAACAADESGLWEHAFLKHNEPELNRLITNVKPFLFS